MPLDKSENIVSAHTKENAAETSQRRGSLTSNTENSANESYRNLEIRPNETASVTGTDDKSLQEVKTSKNDQKNEQLNRMIDVVVAYSRVSTETKERLRNAVTDVYCKLMSEEEACRHYQLAVSYFRTYYTMVEKLLNRINIIKEDPEKTSGRKTTSIRNESGIKKLKNEETENSYQAGSGDTNTDKKHDQKKRNNGWSDLTHSISKIDKMSVEKCIDDICGSVRHLTKKRAIESAVKMVLFDGYSGTEAARINCLTPRTVIRNVYAVHDALNLSVLQRSKQQTTQKDKKISTCNTDLETAQLLLDEKFGHIGVDDFTGSVSNLKSKIDKLLQEFKCSCDVREVRASLVKLFMNQKDFSETEGNMEQCLAIVNSYARLLKGFFLIESMIKISGQDSFCRSGNKKRKMNDGEKNEGCSKFSTSDETTPAKKNRESGNVLDPRGMFVGMTDVLALHLENGFKDEEKLIKSVISYLIGHQYRRSYEAQTNMQICLEYVLLDGLSVAETLEIHDGPSENILEIYQKRCRDALTALTVDFPAFVATLNTLNEKEKNVVRKKRSRLLDAKFEETKNVKAECIEVFECRTVEDLLIHVPEKVKMTLHLYIIKLLDINFPLETRLVSGLLKMIADKMKAEFVLPGNVLEDFVAYFRNKHSRSRLKEV
ncbi:unnamed protein product [Thelazia callipaeda]|uniref:MIF4G domain-containing protein n=1 Tax=Thelazia callipaeda TaxID=103827 RepID=A0A0N5D808_THECL|nr:unnamed protein product [Thelazia callipaeda]